MAEGRRIEVRIPMADGVELATTLYLPAVGIPVPCILEALPYRKDDLTAYYRPEYVRLRDDHGYAVARVDVRGTGSSGGIAIDEYPAQEQQDLCEVIAWLAAQSWCNGSIGMYGTSYSGFNSLQVAAEQPPALKAIIAIYATDDRYTDDVHYMGGSLRLIDLVDYPLYMVAMNALPPVPEWTDEAGRERWRAQWRERVECTEPWLLRWLEEQRDGGYWRHGSLRPGYDRIACPTMIVAGWADGYRNNTFRTIEALSAAGTPYRLLVGPWSHMATNTSLPGPNIDLVPEMVRWWDRWLRPKTDVAESVPITLFARRSSRPEADLPDLEGEWRNEPAWPLSRVHNVLYPLGTGLVDYIVKPDVGVSAWNSCGGALPWGQPTDQRYDDADSVTWDRPIEDGLEVLGHARVTLRLASTAPVANISVKLCDVFPDGASTLVTRGFLNLTRRSSLKSPEPVPVGEFMDVEVEFEATSWRWEPGHILRVAIAGTDWPNTIAPPEPLTLTIDKGASHMCLPVVTGPSPCPPPVLVATRPDRSGDHDGVLWRIERDVLARTTSCVVDHGSVTKLADGTTSEEHYAGRVTVNTRTFEQQAVASARFAIGWSDVAVSSEVSMTFSATTTTFDVSLSLSVHEDGLLFAERTWSRTIPRDLC